MFLKWQYLSFFHISCDKRFMSIRNSHYRSSQPSEQHVVFSLWSVPTYFHLSASSINLSNLLLQLRNDSPLTTRSLSLFPSEHPIYIYFCFFTAVCIWSIIAVLIVVMYFLLKIICFMFCFLHCCLFKILLQCCYL